LAVVIGSATTLTSTLFSSGGVVSVNFGIQANINRLFELGSFSPYDTFVQKQRTLSIVVYGKKLSGAGGSQSILVTPSTSCVDTGAISITVNPGVCGTPVNPFTDNFYPTSYSYSKENLGHGQESWSFTSKPILDSYNGTIIFLRGIATGQILTGAGVMTEANMGVVVDTVASRDSLGNFIEGEQGSVSAGFPGIGNYDIQREVVVTRVGGSLGRSDGKRGQSQVTIPMTPVFL
jgi:hypothetical protein